DFPGAYAALDGLNGNQEQEEVRRAHALVSFRHAHALAQQGSFRDALAKAEEALALEPDEQAILDLVAEMRKLAPEEEGRRLLRGAQDALEAERFDEAIRLAGQVAPRSSFAGQARQLRSAALFRRALKRVEGQQFDQALADLREALELNTDEEERQVLAR